MILATNEELIRLCRKNDRKAQNLLFEKFKKKVLFICMRYADSEDAAKDLLQESFIRIFKSLISSDHAITSLEAWVHRIAVNTAVDEIRKKRLPMVGSELSSLSLASEGVTPLESMSAAEILTIIQEMPEGYRLVFNLFIVEGYDHEEIAKKLDISESTSRSQLTRAKEWLKKRFGTESAELYERIYG